MRRAFLIFAVPLSFAANGATAQGDLNPSPYQTRTEQFAEVRKVKVAGPFHVMVLADAKENAVTLFGPPELLADASARIEDGVLMIGFREGAKWSWNPGSGMHAVVHLAVLESVETDGAARVETVSTGTAVPSFSAIVNGSGKIKVSRLEAQSVSLALGGSGSIDIDGRAQEVAYALGGAGTIDAKGLRAGSGTISVGGAGSVYADIAGAAQISVGGPGKVEVVGGATCTTRALRPEQVECR